MLLLWPFAEYATHTHDEAGEPDEDDGELHVPFVETLRDAYHHHPTDSREDSKYELAERLFRGHF
jgi:hypothetical protein